MNENKNNNNNGFYETSTPVYAYKDLIKPFRQNVKVEGFDFDVNTFENLIDNFVPEKNIKTILHCTGADLDRFCQIVYKMNFKEAYKVLVGVTDMFMRKAIKGLSQEGNPTALKIAAEHFMDLREQNQADAINITFVNDLKEGDE